MNRGDVIIGAPLAPFDKPRPLMVVQAERFDVGETIMCLPITSDLSWMPALRVPVAPSAVNGLRKASEVMVDMIQTFPLSRIGGFAGSMNENDMRRVGAALRLFLGLP